jgi:hypothetical protein
MPDGTYVSPWQVWQPGQNYLVRRNFEHLEKAHNTFSQRYISYPVSSIMSENMNPYEEFKESKKKPNLSDVRGYP